MRVLVIASCAVFALGVAGCKKAEAPAYSQYADQAVKVDLIKPPAPEAAPADAAAKAAMPVSVPMLAYTYSYTITAPAKAVQSLQAADQQACSAAGPAVCQVTAATSNKADFETSASLEIRATPQWIAAFKTGLPAEVKAVGGYVSESQTQTEDLTRQIVDTEAAVRAKTTLRDRLQGILATHPGKVSDLLDVEKELANVQGELDASQSELAVAKTRVATSVLTLRYQSSDQTPVGGWSPLTGALHGTIGTLAATLSVMVTLTVALLPWVLVLAAAVWVWRKPIARWREKQKARVSPKQPEPPSLRGG